MGLMDSIQNQMDTTRKIELKNAMELDELLAIIEEKVDPSLGKPQLKKGLTGKSIVFPKTSRVTPKITVKGNKVTVSKITDGSSSSVSVGGFKINTDKDMRGANAVKTLDAGAEYFKSVADAVTAALADK